MYIKKRLRFIAVALLTLTAPGICRAEDEAAPFAATDWPQFRGPTQSGTTETEYELVEHLDDAKLVWISDERNLGVGWGLGHGSSGAGQTAERACGYAAPVVAGGRVFIQYFEPTAAWSPLSTKRSTAARRHPCKAIF